MFRRFGRERDPPEPEEESEFDWEGENVVAVDLDRLYDWGFVDELVGRGFEVLAVNAANVMLLRKPAPMQTATGRTAAVEE
jgi:hypothetical protein